MSDNSNDTYSLLRYLDGGANPWWADSVRALVAERNNLKQRVANLTSENVRLHYEMEENPPADRDRELRERLVESALRGVNVSGLHRSEAELIGTASVWMVDAAIAAMRKGEA